MTHPDLARSFACWARLARGGVPADRDFDPMAAAFSLPHLQLCRRIDDGNGCSDCRLDPVGESAAQLIGANSRGKTPSQALASRRLRERLAAFDQALADGLRIAYLGFLAIPGREHRLQKRLLLPFVEGDAGPDILVAMVVGLRIEPDQMPILGRSEGILEAIAARRGDVEAAAAEF